MESENPEKGCAGSTPFRHNSFRGFSGGMAFPVGQFKLQTTETNTLLLWKSDFGTAKPAQKQTSSAEYTHVAQMESKKGAPQCPLLILPPLVPFSLTYHHKPKSFSGSPFLLRGSWQGWSFWAKEDMLLRSERTSGIPGWNLQGCPMLPNGIQSQTGETRVAPDGALYVAYKIHCKLPAMSCDIEGVRAKIPQTCPNTKLRPN